MNRAGDLMETYLSITDLAAYIKCSEQTIRRYVLNKTVPYHKILKAVRFRLSEIEKWIDEDGMDGKAGAGTEDEREGDLFAGLEGAEGGGAVEGGEGPETDGTAEVRE